MPRPRALCIACLCIVAVACTPTRKAFAPTARESGFVTTNDGARIYYERAGTGPTMLLLHGLAGNHAAWFHQVPYFAREHRVIAIAQRGFAPSSENRGAYDNERLVADSIAVLERLGETNVAVVGQSMGGWTALGLAIERPDLVRAVVLSASVGGIFDAQIAAHYEQVTARARELASKPPVLGLHPALGSRFTTEHPDDAYLYQLLTSFGAPSPSKVAEGLGRTHFDDAQLANVHASVLFVVGEDDLIFPPDIVRRAAARIAGARLETIPGAGHSPYFEQPTIWNRLVHDFLAAAVQR